MIFFFFLLINQGRMFNGAERHRQRVESLGNDSILAKKALVFKTVYHMAFDEVDFPFCNSILRLSTPTVKAFQKSGSRSESTKSAKAAGWGKLKRKRGL